MSNEKKVLDSLRPAKEQIDELLDAATEPGLSLSERAIRVEKVRLAHNEWVEMMGGQTPPEQKPEPEPLGVGDVVQAQVDGSTEMGIITGHEPRMTPPRYLGWAVFDVLFHPGDGERRDGLLMNGCTEGPNGAGLRRAADAGRFLERLEAMAKHGDLAGRSLAALQLVRRREVELLMARGELEPMPVPHVVKPTLLQLVKGARVHWEDSKGTVHQGWVHDFGMWKDVYARNLPEAPRVSIQATRPGVMSMSMAMPDTVLVERVLRVTCFPDPSPEACWACHQGGEPKGGEYECEVCHRPTVHGEAQEPTVSMGASTQPRPGPTEAATQESPEDFVERLRRDGAFPGSPRAG